MAASQDPDRAADHLPGWPARPNILVVDDESLSRRIVSTLLIKCNYNGACPDAFIRCGRGLPRLHI
jgi:hypothetical protein